MHVYNSIRLHGVVPKNGGGSLSIRMGNASQDLFIKNQHCLCKSTSPHLYISTDFWKETQVIRPIPNTRSRLGDGTKETFIILFELRTYMCIN